MGGDVSIASLLAGYHTRDGFYDELLADPGLPRPHAAALVEALESLGPDQLASAGRRRDAILKQQGNT
jgi:uncharacterized circularly permuted ATP-grasp superfamily protein